MFAGLSDKSPDICLSVVFLEELNLVDALLDLHATHVDFFYKSKGSGSCYKYRNKYGVSFP